MLAEIRLAASDENDLAAFYLHDAELYQPLLFVRSFAVSTRDEKCMKQKYLDSDTALQPQVVS